MITIVVNGDKISLEKALSIRQLLEQQKVATPEYVTVQLNGEFVASHEFDQTMLNEEDVIDFLYFMGGGR